MRPRGPKDRQWLLFTWFCRNLRHRAIGVKLQKWWENQPITSDGLVQRAQEKVREKEQIQQEAELEQQNITKRVVRGVASLASCVLCGQQGRLGVSVY